MYTIRILIFYVQNISVVKIYIKIVFTLRIVYLFKNILKRKGQRFIELRKFSFLL